MKVYWNFYVENIGSIVKIWDILEIFATFLIDFPHTLSESWEEDFDLRN